MDTLLHDSSSMAKRPCPSQSQNPRFQNLHQVDHLLEAFLSLVEFPSFSLHLSLDRLLHSLPTDADQTLLIHRALRMGSLLLDAANYSSRKRASSHNSLVWPLPPDLTIKVFSMLDTQSLCYAAATCSFFNKCAKDPLCYANLDLRTTVPKINNAVVSSMIQRAAKALRSLKLGLVPGATALPGSQPLAYTIRNTIVEVSNFSWNDKRSRQGRESSILTRSCLTPLNGDNGAPGAFLRMLHLYNIERMDNLSLAGALSACPSLLDLEIVGLDCMHLKELEVARLLTAILGGDFKSLVHLDISNREGLASEGDWYHRCYNSSIMPIKQVLEARSNLCLLAEYPSEGSYAEPFDDELNSDISLPSQLSSHTSDGSNFMSTSESSYNGDQGSGNEDGQEGSYVIYMESSDEVDHFTL